MANGHTKAFAGCFVVPLVAALLLLPAATLPAQEPNPADANYFSRYIQPVFEQKCLNCHNGKSNVSKLDLTSRESLMRGGDNGPAIVAGDAEKSLLFKSITHKSHPFMPMGMDRLSQHEIDRIAAWINAGASYGAPASAGAQEDEKWLKGQKLFSENVQPLFETTCLK
jgi:mono/diheme cytochrome c family protein